MTRSRFLFISAVVVGALHPACKDAAVPFMPTSGNSSVISSMRPAYFGLKSNGDCETDPEKETDEDINEAPHNPKLKLYWLGQCDHVKMRYRNIFLMTGAEPFDICNPPDPGSVDLGKVSLVKSPNGVRASVVHAVEFGPFRSGCEDLDGNREFPETEFPPDFTDINTHYLLRLVGADEASIDFDALKSADEDDASQRVAYVGETPVVMAPRVLTLKGCSKNVDDDRRKPCIAWTYKWRGSNGIEVFSPNIRIKSVRAVEGSVNSTADDGIEKDLYKTIDPDDPILDATFKCTADMSSPDGCKSIPFEWVQANLRAHRCLNRPQGVSEDYPNAVNISENCINPQERPPPYPDAEEPISLAANPLLLIDTLAALPEWEFSFNNAGFPPPQADDDGIVPVLAVQFILESL